MIRRMSVVIFVAMAGHAFGQSQKLNLQDALNLARENNGNVLSARLNYEAAKANTRAANSAFLPTLTPNIDRIDGRQNVLTGPLKGGSAIRQTDASITASWLLFDNGSRNNSYRQSRISQELTENNSLDIYRSVLFEVHSAFYSALRAQQLLKVSESSYKRAVKLQDAAEKKEEVGFGPKKDILQAKADALNAKVNVLTSANSVSTSLANLRAILGLSDQANPELEDNQDTQPKMVDYTLEQAIADGMANRPSLKAAALQVDLQNLNVAQARLNGSVSFQASANISKSFSESQFDRSTLNLTASYPLFDGWKSKELVRSAVLNLESEKASFEQTKRTVRAEIESSYKEFQQNFERKAAAQLALEAAKLNYEAASGSYEAGAGTILDELTALVSLTTAESNYVQSFYDLLISEVKLQQVTGRPMPGEN